MAVTPVAGVSTQVTTGGQSVVAVGTSPNGGLIYNPASASEQGVSGTPEPLYVDPVGPCGTPSAGGTIFCLQPGDTWTLIPGQTTPTYVNAATSGHRFTVASW